MTVKQLVEVMYPVLYPIEQQDIKIQERHYKIVTELAEMVWKEFTDSKFRLTDEEVKTMLANMEAKRRAEENKK